jgi:mannose-6-phosphate isomerase-like protein (cupin superfamily)
MTMTQVMVTRPDGTNVAVEEEQNGSMRRVVEKAATSEVFDLCSPYLLQGRTTDVRSRTDLMTVTVKVYAEGGENGMHAHMDEDHTFIVLEGEAEFHLDSDENTKRLTRYQGVMIPKGAAYWFQALGDENLVMVRIGASESGFQRHARRTPDGREIPGDSAENKTVARVEKPGPGFGS